MKNIPLYKIPNEELTNIYLDTVEKSKQFMLDATFPHATTKHTFSEILDIQKYQLNISVENLDTISALVKYDDESIEKICLLNMASYKKPGGGVKRGAKAQEEGLFRCSTLSEMISDMYYPLNPNECIYTQNAIFFKNSKYQDIYPITCDVVTMPAVNLNGLEMKPNYVETVRNKIKLMLSLAIKNNVDTIILGAWGCGVFKNDPRIISQLFKEVLIDDNYHKAFQRVVFAIINDHNSVDSNYEIFKQTFKFT